PDNSRSSILEILGKQIGVVTGLAEDLQGNIWISSGATFSGAYRWDGSRWDHYSLSTDSSEFFGHKIKKDRQGRLWFLGISPRGRQPGAYMLDNGKFIH